MRLYSNTYHHTMMSFLTHKHGGGKEMSKTNKKTNGSTLADSDLPDKLHSAG